MSDLSKRDQKVVWHPFTQMKNAKLPIPIVRGKGALLYDEQNNEYIDAVASWWVNVHGHSHPYIQKKVSDQLLTLEHTIFAGFTHPWAVELAERILKINPANHSKVFFSDNGSTAVEVGIKMALQYWWNKSVNKTKVIAFDNGYHGDTVGAMSVGGRGVFTAPFDSIMFDVIHIDVPNGSNNSHVIREFSELVASGEVAAFIYEPMIQGAGGMIAYDMEGMNQLMKIARSNEVILIADEVMTGFGRTGKMFASEYYEVMPDIMTLSKALTGGTMPLSLTTCKEYIFDNFISEDKLKTFFHGHSYTGNPTACSAALASLALMENPDFKDNITRVHLQHQKFATTLRSISNVKNIRLVGTIIAFDVITDEKDSYLNNIRDVLYDAFIAQRVILRPLGNTVYILPPYVITNDQLEKVYNVIIEVLSSIHNKG
ncbi:MAG: adenosylmethionine--8-amino-7-oxononanoate transaminase [Chitinophagales bacterium]